MNIETIMEQVAEKIIRAELERIIGQSVVAYLREHTSDKLLPAVKLAIEDLMKRSSVLTYIINARIADHVKKELEARISVTIAEKKER